MHSSFTGAAKDAAHLARMIDRDVMSEPDDTVAVPVGFGFAPTLYSSPRNSLVRRYLGVSLAGLPERGGAGLVLATSDLGAAERRSAAPASAAETLFASRLRLPMVRLLIFVKA